MPSAPRPKKTTAPPPDEARVYLLTGAEAGRKNAEANALLQRFVDADYADFDADTIDGTTATAERALSGAAGVPLGTGKRVVLVRDTQQMEAEEQKRLAAGLPNIPSQGVLILHTGTPITEDGKTRRQSIVITELSNAVKKVGRVLEFALAKTEDIQGWLLAEAKALDKTLAPDALSLLAQLPGEDLNRVGMELAKAAAYAGEAAVITGADVQATLSRSPDDVIFKLCDAVGARRRPEALGHVSTLFRSGMRPDAIAPRVLVLLARQIRLLAQFRYLGERKMAGRNATAPTPEVLALLPGDGAGGMISNPRLSWMAEKYVGQARNFSGGELADRMEKLLTADLALKGIVPGGESPLAVIQRLVIELC